MKRVLSVCAVMFLLAGVYLYAENAKTTGGLQEELSAPELPSEILTDANVVDAGNHVAAYRVPWEDVEASWAVKELFQGDYIALCDLDSGRRIYLPDTYGTILELTAETPGEIALRYRGGDWEERGIRIPIAFAPPENDMQAYAYYHRDRVVAALQELDAETFPVKVWSETFAWKGKDYETAFERVSPLFDLQLEAGGLFADYCLTVRDGEGNLISSREVANYPVRYEEVYWFTDLSKDGVPDVAVCTDMFWGRTSRSCLETWIWDGESRSYQGKLLPSGNNPSMPLWDAEQSILVSFEERDEVGEVIVNMYTYANDQWALVKAWIPLYWENLWFDEAKNIRRPDSYRVADYADGEVVGEEIVAAEEVWEDGIWDRHNEQYSLLYPADPEWEEETALTGAIPVDRYVRTGVERNEITGEKEAETPEYQWDALTPDTEWYEDRITYSGCDKIPEAYYEDIKGCISIQTTTPYGAQQYYVMDRGIIMLESLSGQLFYLEKLDAESAGKNPTGYLSEEEREAVIHDLYGTYTIEAFLPTKFYPAKDASGEVRLPREEADGMIGREIRIEEERFITYDNFRLPNSVYVGRAKDAFLLEEIIIPAPEYRVTVKPRDEIYGLRDDGMLPEDMAREEYVEVSVYPGYDTNGERNLPQLYLLENGRAILYAMGEYFLLQKNLVSTGSI